MLKKQMLTRLLISNFVVLAMMFVACSKSSDIDWEHNGQVCIVLAWEKTQQTRPLVMTYYFYTDSSDVPLIREGNADGYVGVIPKGHYRVFACNENYRNVSLETNKGFDEALAIAEPTSSVVKAVTNIYVKQPEKLYNARGTAIESRGEEPALVSLPAGGLTKTLQLNVKVMGLDSIVHLEGTLSGLSPAMQLSSSMPRFSHPVAVTFDLEKESSEIYQTTLSLFGIFTGNETEDPIEPYLFLTVTQGNGVTYTARGNLNNPAIEPFNRGEYVSLILDVEARPSSTDVLDLTVKEWREGTAEAK